ncbi:Uncharacterized protein TCM_036644 [Theobroma cacao]|uniref:Uncharacterized protein n=1 Tax=Theobroma cacao TaxID=3641 RepID=A0A061FJD9_THECC|nr:Uncharacterized protein TCM_036644 [Theobroma cacao]
MFHNMNIQFTQLINMTYISHKTWLLPESFLGMPWPRHLTETTKAVKCLYIRNSSHALALAESHSHAVVHLKCTQIFTSRDTLHTALRLR